MTSWNQVSIGQRDSQRTCESPSKRRVSPGRLQEGTTLATYVTTWRNSLRKNIRILSYHQGSPQITQYLDKLDATFHRTKESKERLVKYLKGELLKRIRTPIYKETLEKQTVNKLRTAEWKGKESWGHTDPLNPGRDTNSKNSKPKDTQDPVQIQIIENPFELNLNKT